jgi:glycosyltransferase involved in cell wall biosynthesis
MSDDPITKLRVARLSTSFASLENPGSGLNAYYHSRLSKARNLVITEAKAVEYLPLPPNVELFLVSIKPYSLGSLDAGLILRTKNTVLKVISTLTFLWEAHRKLNDFRPEIVHLYTPIHFITGMYCKVMFGSKVVVSLHGTDVLRLEKSYILRQLLSCMDHVFLLSEKMITDLKLDVVRCSFIGNGFDDEFFFPGNQVERKKIVLTVGNLRWQKDHSSLLLAFSMFKENHPEYRLLIVGEGDLEAELRALSRKLNIEDSVFFLGKLEPKKVGELMRESMIFVLSSISEGSPKVVLEALSCGLPVVATDVGDMHKILGAGSVCPVQDTKEMARVMGVKCYEAPDIVRDTLAATVSSRTWSAVVHFLEVKYLAIRDLG